MKQISGIFFAPPMAYARLGGSSVPVESFDWADDPSIYGAGRTVILPAISLEVTEDGSVFPYLPSIIRFRDGGLLRPVAPFFELWANVVHDGKPAVAQPLTRKLLEDLGGSLSGVQYSISLANLKAARRTGDQACSFIAQAELKGDDHVRRKLWASSPHNPGVQPLVFPDRPILLGQFQVIRPAAPTMGVSPSVMGVDLGVLRVRFTPAAGEVYGPPETIWGYAPYTRRAHMIVKPENRILNPEAAWMHYDADYRYYKNPEPADTYDGADVDPTALNRSWGVVDDTCDGTINANVVIQGQRFMAAARVISGPPDFSPDRRPFVSIADDLADRDLPLDAYVPGQVAQAVIADLFQRAFETSSICSVDSNRQRALSDNTQMLSQTSGPSHSLPATDQQSMTPADMPFFGSNPGVDVKGTPQGPLPFSAFAQAKHENLAQIDALISFIREQPEQVRRIIRPPYARFDELSTQAEPMDQRRDPRIPRDTAHDMRMPPYMRDSDGTALSLTWRQYHQLMDFVDRLVKEPKAEGDAVARAEDGVDQTPARRHVRQVYEKGAQGPGR